MSAESYFTNDEKLVQLSQKGDLKAFEGLVKEYEKKMLNIAYRLTGNYDEACEVVQDAFVLAYRNIRSFRGVSKFSTWLSTIVINTSKKHLIQKKTKRYYEPISMDEPSGEGKAREYESPNPAADDIIQQKQIMERLQICLKTLDGEFREVVVLRDIEDIAYEEIGNMLRIPEGTVKSRLFRARAILKNCLRHFAGG